MITIKHTIGSRLFTVTRLRGQAETATTREMLDAIEQSGFKLFRDRVAEVTASVRSQLRPLLEREAAERAEDEALLAEWPEARIAYPRSDAPFSESRRASADEIRSALALRKGNENRVVLRRYEIGCSAGEADVVYLAA